MKSKDIVNNAINDNRLTFYSTSERGKVAFDSGLFIQYLEKYGYRTISIGGSVELVKIEDCIVSKTNPSDIKQFLKQQTQDAPDIHNYLLNSTRLFSLNFLDALKRVKLDMHRDTATSSYHYFRNGVVEVTKDEIKEPIPYAKFERLIWKDHILECDFDNNINIDNTAFLDFIKKLCGNDRHRIEKLFSIIGYCLHDYRRPNNAKAVIINDEMVSDQPEGGSGKSLLVMAMSKVRKTKEYDGKRFEPKDSFAWQNVDESVKIVSIDDARRGFCFEDLFSAITQGFSINRKNKDEYFLPLEQSPIIVITTNNVIRGFSGSFKRRQYNVDICQYFNSNHTPEAEYQQIFFSAWNSEQWQQFYKLMLDCVRAYLLNGVVEVPEIDKQRKDAIRCTNESFVEWMNECIEDMASFCSTNHYRNRYLDETGQRNLKLSDKKFKNYVQSYCEIYGYTFAIERQGNDRGYRISKR